MMHQDDFFTPEDIDRQIDQVSQGKAGERADAEALAYLRSYYRTAPLQEQAMLNRIWGRIAPALPSGQEQERENMMQDRSGDVLDQSAPYSTMSRGQPQRPRRALFMRRLETLAAVAFLIILVGGMALVFYTIRHTPVGTGSNHPTATPTTAHALFQVTAVDMVVTPASIAGRACGTQLTVTYIATFHVAPNSAGGVVQFGYTVNNGRGQQMARLTFGPGETRKTYTFTWSGALPVDHTYPEPGGVQVTSPNALTSKLVGPTGMCTTAAFRVTAIDMAVSPTSIAGLACGSSLTVTYTATIHVAPGSPGGTVLFGYTVNNGRGEQMARLTFGPGETTKTYTFTWSGTLPPDHTYPGQGGVQVTSPNAITSALVGPTGRCK